jgi:hypothetical protein
MDPTKPLTGRALENALFWQSINQPERPLTYHAPVASAPDASALLGALLGAFLAKLLSVAGLAGLIGGATGKGRNILLAVAVGTMLETAASYAFLPRGPSIASLVLTPVAALAAAAVGWSLIGERLCDKRAASEGRQAQPEAAQRET